MNFRRRQTEALELIAETLIKIKWLVSADINFGDEE